MCKICCRNCNNKFRIFVFSGTIKCKRCGQVTYIKKQSILQWVQGILIACLTIFVSSYSRYGEKLLNLPVYAELIIFIIGGVIFIDSIYSVVVTFLYNKGIMKYFLVFFSKKIE